VALAVVLVLAGAGCGAALPDPASPGARVLVARCGGCHRVYAPGSMTAEMWRVQMERMRALFAQRGIPWLSPADEQAVRDYLTAHAGSA
jgi:Dihaem cytochrome c